MKKTIAALRKAWRDAMNGTRYPYTKRSARFVVAAWSLAGLSAAWGIAMALILGRPDWTLAINVPVLVFDVAMLRMAIRGLLYRRKVEAYMRGMANGE